MVGQIYGQSKKKPDIGDLFLNAGTELTSTQHHCLSSPISHIMYRVQSMVGHYGRLILLLKQGSSIVAAHLARRYLCRTRCCQHGTNWLLRYFYCCLILHFPLAKSRFTSRLPSRLLHCLFSVMWGPNAMIQSPNLHWSAGYPTACQLVDCRDGFVLGNFSHILSQRTKFLGLSTDGRTAGYPDLFSQ